MKTTRTPVAPHAMAEAAMLTSHAQVVQAPGMIQMKTIPSRSATSVMAKAKSPWTCVRTVAVPVNLE